MSLAERGGKPESVGIKNKGRVGLPTVALTAALVGMTGAIAAPYVTDFFHHSGTETHASYVPSRDTVLKRLALPTDGDALVVGEKQRYDAAALTYNFLRTTPLWRIPMSTGGTIGDGMENLYSSRDSIFVDNMYSTVSTDKTNNYLNTTLGVGTENFWSVNPIVEGSGIHVTFLPFSNARNSSEKDRTLATVYLTVTPKGYESGWGSNVFTQQTAREYITHHFGEAYKFVEFDSPRDTSQYVLAIDGNKKVQLDLNGRLNYTTVITQYINYSDLSQAHTQPEVAAQVGYAVATTGVNSTDQIERIVLLEGQFSPSQIASLIEITNTDPLSDGSGQRYTQDLGALQTLLNAATPLLHQPAVNNNNVQVI